MSSLRRIWARIRGATAGPRAEDELREELEAHVEMQTAENIRRGMDPDDARREALLASGGVSVAVDAVRDQRGLPWISSIAHDVKFALRALRHSPAFTSVVIITLALGIGANTAIFSVVRGVLLKPLPNRDGDRIVYVRHSVDGPAGENIAFSVPEIRDFRNGAKSFGGIAEFSPFYLNLEDDNASSRLDVDLVSGNFFDVLGLTPELGRLTRPSDDGTGVPPVMVLTHDFWIKHYGGDSSIVGKQLRMGGIPVTVIGVLQPAPLFPQNVDAMLNLVVSAHHTSAMMVEGRTHRMTEMLVRLKPNATLAQARTEAVAVHARMMRDHRDAYDSAAHDRVTVIPFKEALGERAQLTLWLLMAAAAFVMIISAANVVNLTLMRGVRREHELVLRAALGAGVPRLRRLLLVENLLLTLVGAALGVLIAIGGVGLLTSLAERYSPRASEIRLDVVVLSFTLALSVLIALLLSFVASMPREGELSSLLAAGVRRISGGVRRQRLQRGLVVAQVAVSVVLLAGAGLLTRTMIRLSEVNTGLKTEEVLTMPVDLFNPAHYDSTSDATIRDQFERMRSDVRALPGVVEAGLGSTMPLRASEILLDIKADGKVLNVGAATPHADIRSASPEYFRAGGIPLIEGREFTTADRAGSAQVVIINKTLAQQFFPGEDAVGQRIALTGDVLRFTPFTGDWRTVVGVVGDTRDGGLDAEPRGVMFMPFAQSFAVGGLVIRADSNVSGLISAATRIVHRIAPEAPVENVMTIAQIKDQSVSPRRLNAVLVSSFGILALIIAAVGIAGVLAFSVSARVSEIGIRMSLGADSGRVQWMILREGGILLVIGLALGIAGAVFAARVIRGLLFGVTPYDPLTFIVVTVTMAAIGIVACWIPALRAARIDPATSMRS